MKRRLCPPLLAAVICLMAAPSAAFGLDYCVGSPPGCAGTVEPDLQTALDAAKANAGADRVLIGPGTYTRLDGFDYFDNDGANTVEIRGVGTPKPTLTMTASAIDFPTVLNISQNGSLVADLAIEIPNSGMASRGLFLTNGDTAQNLTVTGPDPAPNQQTGIQMTAATVTNSVVSVSPQQSIAIFVQASGPASVTDSTFIGSRGIDVAVSGGQTATFRRNRISATNDGFLMYFGDIDIDNTLIDLRGGGGVGISMDTVPLTLDTNTVDASQLTIRNGGASSIGVRQTNNDPNSVQTIDLRESIIRDVGHPFVQDAPTAGSTYTINSDHNDYDQALSTPQPPLGAGRVRNETNLVNVDPLFLAPVNGANGLSGDYRLAFNSPLIDAGSATMLGTGELDLRGLARIVDGVAPFSGAVRDLGAYEYQWLAPTAQATAAPGAATVGQPITFSGGGSSDPDGDSLTYAWSFDDGTGAIGATVAHAFPSAGAHLATLTVTDPTGLTAGASAIATISPPAAATSTFDLAAAKKKCKKKFPKGPKRKKCIRKAKKKAAAA